MNKYLNESYQRTDYAKKHPVKFLEYLLGFKFKWHQKVSIYLSWKFSDFLDFMGNKRRDYDLSMQ